MQRFGDHRQGSALLLRCRVGSLLGLTPESCLAQDMTRGMAMWPPSIASSKSSQCCLTCKLTPADSHGTGHSPFSSGPAMVHFHRASALCWTRLPSPAPIQDLHNHAGNAQLLLHPPPPEARRVLALQPSCGGIRWRGISAGASSAHGACRSATWPQTHALALGAQVVVGGRAGHDSWGLDALLLHAPRGRLILPAVHEVA